MTEETRRTYDRIVTHGTSPESFIFAINAEVKMMKGCDENILRERLDGVAYALQRFSRYEYIEAGRRRKYFERPLRKGAED